MEREKHEGSLCELGNGTRVNVLPVARAAKEDLDTLQQREMVPDIYHDVVLCEEY